MAIGSDGEIGKQFGRWGDMTSQQQDEWFEYMRAMFGPDLMGGYGSVHYPDRTRYAHVEM